MNVGLDHFYTLVQDLCEHLSTVGHVPIYLL